MSHSENKDLLYYTRQATHQEESIFEKQDSGNCAVRAISIAFEVDYAVAYALLQDAGRKHGKGTTVSQILSVSRKLAAAKGYVVRDSRIQKPSPFITAAKIASDYLKSGVECTVFSISRNHITTIVNGKILDTFVDTRPTHILIAIQKKTIDTVTTNVAKMSQDERQKLFFELVEKMSRKTFANDPEKDKIVSLMQMLDKYKPEGGYKESEWKDVKSDFNFEL